MRFAKAAVVAVAVALVPGTVAAQTSTTPSTFTQGGTQQPPVAGANSFTEAQAKEALGPDTVDGLARETKLPDDDELISNASGPTRVAATREKG